MRADDINDIIRATHTYARGLDLHDPKEAASAFTSDCVWDATAVGLKRFEGEAEVLAFFEADAAGVNGQCHIITNHIIDFDDDDHAHGTNYVYAEGEMKNGGSIKAIALNKDRYARTQDGWKIAERVIEPLTTPQMEGFDV
ncbi:nuclear transport factor 2 family protein [Gordonia sp. HNM0687]|uniref:Nuclear transport factor 2 family protein n=1 Tax=Gordonia mangrovi TaxID=2665643 RepID=A0A6L7GVY7_9ACTN|nr:nuclear transport factor 2 family protein [Gordonia mangrovi]MXP24234.1 nuclear transport factor 2 family protein [Gordonia mangrovi]UVF79945.1 nuclear transport factor 2 family protein [Gordonia mangrovi]